MFRSTVSVTNRNESLIWIISLRPGSKIGNNKAESIVDAMDSIASITIKPELIGICQWRAHES